MKDYVTYRATDTGYSLNKSAAEANLSATPTLANTGPTPINQSPENSQRYFRAVAREPGHSGQVKQSHHNRVLTQPSLAALGA